MKRQLWLAFGAIVLSVAVYGCEKVGGIPAQPTETPIATATPTVTPTVTPSATPTSSPAACQTPDITNPNVVLVGIASGFAATTSTYGNIAGYAVVDPTGASPPPASAALINQTIAHTPITPNNVIQFANLEPGDSNLIHSAIGFPGNGFPAKPYSLPSPLPLPTANAVSSTNAWSTGLLGTPAQSICYSREFTLSPGTYFFGDYSYYNITTFQDVLIVSP